jgi:hypothetical protein
MSTGQIIQGSVGAREQKPVSGAPMSAQLRPMAVTSPAKPSVSAVNAQLAPPQTLAPPVVRRPPARPAPQKAVVVVPPTGPAPEKAPPGSDVIAAFIELEAEARASATLEALQFAIVNATRKLAPYDQAFLLRPAGNGSWRMALASSVDKVDRSAALVRSVEAFCEAQVQDRTQKTDEVRPVDLTQVTGSTAGRGLWVPIKRRGGEVAALLLAVRQDEWRPQQVMLLSTLSGAYGHAWAALEPRHAKPIAAFARLLTARRFAVSALLIGLLGAFVPVPLTTLAPAEVVAASPSQIAAPIDGVIKDVLVAPGSTVSAGTPLVRFVDTKPRSDVEVATRAKALAEARYFKVLQSALSTDKDMEELSIAKGELAVATVELSAAREVLSRTEVKADRAGLAIYSAKSDWIGKPVTVGERIMEIGDPARTELKIDLPISDAIALKPGDSVALFADGDPLRPIEAKVARVGYRPVVAHDQQMVFRIFATFADAEARRIGLHGTARVSGDKVSLWFYLLRRPLSMLRQQVGF